MLMLATTQTAAPPRRRGGRKRDARRGGEILDVALEVLAEVGFDGMTIGMVAARAGAGKATLYRRWPSKTDLVLDAVRRMGSTEVALDALPDTGSLREDVVGLIRPQTLGDEERRLKVMTGLMVLAAREPRLAEAANQASTSAWVEANRLLIQRSLDRGEFSGDVDVDTLAQVIPMMCTSRVSVQQQPITRGFLVAIIDGVLVPALRGSPPTAGD